MSRSPRCHRMHAHHGRVRLGAICLLRQDAPGNDVIPLTSPNKHCKNTLLLQLHDVLCQCWQEGAVPQDMRDSKIRILYKNKGERNDCDNYIGISLLSIVGKVVARVILIRLLKLAECLNVASELNGRQ